MGESALWTLVVRAIREVIVMPMWEIIIIATCIAVPIIVIAIIAVLKMQRDGREIAIIERRGHYYRLVAEKKCEALVDEAMRSRETRTALIDIINRSGYEIFTPVPLGTPLAARAQRLLALPEATDRAMGVYILNLFQEPAGLDAARTAIHDADPDVHLTAVRVLGLIGNDHSASILVDALRRGEVAWERVVERFNGPWALPELIKAIQTPITESTREKHFHARLARALGLLGDAAAEPHLQRLLGEGNVEERINVVRALGQCGTHESLALIQDLLRNDESPHVRAQAATALISLPHRSSVPILVQSMFDTSWWVCSNSAQALGSLGLRGKLALEEVRERAPGTLAARRASEQLSILEVTA